MNSKSGKKKFETLYIGFGVNMVAVMGASYGRVGDVSQHIVGGWSCQVGLPHSDLLRVEGTRSLRLHDEQRRIPL